jgi:hypothetical protein
MATFRHIFTCWGKWGVTFPSPLKEHCPRCSLHLNNTTIHASIFQLLQQCFPLLGLVLSQTLGIYHMPTTISNNKHINHNFMQKHFIVVHNSRGKFTYQHNTYLCNSWICIHMAVTFTRLIVFLDIPIVLMIPINR